MAMAISQRTGASRALPGSRSDHDPSETAVPFQFHCGASVPSTDEPKFVCEDTLAASERPAKKILLCLEIRGIYHRRACLVL
jgi:hypothetical protein